MFLTPPPPTRNQYFVLSAECRGEIGCRMHNNVANMCFCTILLYFTGPTKKNNSKLNESIKKKWWPLKLANGERVWHQCVWHYQKKKTASQFRSLQAKGLGRRWRLCACETCLAPMLAVLSFDCTVLAWKLAVFCCCCCFITTFVPPPTINIDFPCKTFDAECAKML